SNDSHLFHTRDELEADGWYLDGNVFIYGEGEMLPLYEAKMLDSFDHRAADVVTSATATKRQNQPSYLSDEDHENGERVSIPKYWVPLGQVEPQRRWLLSFSRVTSTTNNRTFVSAGLPYSAAGDSIFLVDTCDAIVASHLLAVFNSFVFDYVARQKVAGLNLNFFYVKQLPVLAREVHTGPALWNRGTQLRDWVADRVLEMCFTAWDMVSFAEDIGDDGAPFKWEIGRRALLRAELDAAIFHLYGVDMDEVEHIMGTFPIVKRKDEEKYGECRTKRLILEVYDRMAEAIRTGQPYQTILDPPPGQGPRHPARQGG
ncbi:MAG: Eco57I restriction-modification methylase domain-containing protein, partial [Candidatus Binatia bacterium]